MDFDEPVPTTEPFDADAAAARLGKLVDSLADRWPPALTVEARAAIEARDFRALDRVLARIDRLSPLELRDPAVRLRVVRNFGSEKTHVMHVTTATTEIFVTEYWRPSAGKAACGVGIDDAVIMRPGSTVRCGACRHATGLEAQRELEDGELW